MIFTRTKCSSFISFSTATFMSSNTFPQLDDNWSNKSRVIEFSQLRRYAAAHKNFTVVCARPHSRLNGFPHSKRGRFFSRALAFGSQLTTYVFRACPPVGLLHLCVCSRTINSIKKGHSHRHSAAECNGYETANVCADSQLRVKYHGKLVIQMNDVRGRTTDSRLEAWSWNVCRAKHPLLEARSSSGWIEVTGCNKSYALRYFCVYGIWVPCVQTPTKLGSVHAVNVWLGAYDNILGRCVSSSYDYVTALIFVCGMLRIYVCGLLERKSLVLALVLGVADASYGNSHARHCSNGTPFCTTSRIIYV